MGELAGPLITVETVITAKHTGIGYDSVNYIVKLTNGQKSLHGKH